MGLRESCPNNQQTPHFIIGASEIQRASQELENKNRLKQRLNLLLLGASKPHSSQGIGEANVYQQLFF